MSKRPAPPSARFTVTSPDAAVDAEDEMHDVVRERLDQSALSRRPVRQIRPALAVPRLDRRVRARCWARSPSSAAASRPGSRARPAPGRARRPARRPSSRPRAARARGSGRPRREPAAARRKGSAVARRNREQHAVEALEPPPEAPRAARTRAVVRDAALTAPSSGTGAILYARRVAGSCARSSSSTACGPRSAAPARRGSSGARAPTTWR